ncbi:MAG TPA: SGNH/GDSL hydrolase family protein [Candidatus Limnocylindrales bacterium]|nr:SGNH/GDSL hydrolase family protein [Candidatus Limnocylindrales bacterium]
MRSSLRHATVAALLFAFIAAGTASAAPGTSGDHSRSYYVSVGDSLAAGVQPIGDPADLYRTDAGYAEQLLGIAQPQSPKLGLVKLGCPGETTTTMIAGGICSYAHGSQLDEAVAFLRAHRAHVAFVTIDIGANDFPCQTAECVPAGVAAIQSNLPGILAQLRAAAGPTMPIVGMTIYNPFLAYWFAGPDGQAFARASASQLLGPVNALLRGIYEGSGDGVADIERAFSSNDFDTLVDLPGAGTVPLNVARICMWTWVCAPAPYGPDNHANADGYAVIARAYADVLGL